MSTMNMQNLVFIDYIPTYLLTYYQKELVSQLAMKQLLRSQKALYPKNTMYRKAKKCKAFLRMYRCQDFLADFKPGYNALQKNRSRKQKIIEVIYKDTI